MNDTNTRPPSKLSALWNRLFSARGFNTQILSELRDIRQVLNDLSDHARDEQAAEREALVQKERENATYTIEKCLFHLTQLLKDIDNLDITEIAMRLSCADGYNDTNIPQLRLLLDKLSNHQIGLVVEACGDNFGNLLTRMAGLEVLTLKTVKSLISQLEFCLDDRRRIPSTPDDYKDGSAAYNRGDYETAMKKWGLCAEREDLDAQVNLAYMYDNGLGISQDFAEAMRLNRMAAEQDDEIAQYNIGYMFEEGRGVSCDYVEAMHWYHKAAKQGHASAMTNIGRFYIEGLGVEQDLTKAKEWFCKGAERGNSKQQFNLAYRYEHGDDISQNYKKAFEWYLKSSAQAGGSDAMVQLGHLCMQGLGTEQSFEKAVDWFEFADDLGNAYGSQNLGYMYEKGRGIAKNYTKAFSLYRKAAEQGHAPAQCNLGAFYQRGWGVKKDLAEGVRWYRKSAEQGNKMAQYNLGFSCQNGKGVKKDRKEAKFWFRKAAEQGFERAQKQLEKLGG